MGDPDKVPIAFAYGALALGTIYLVEYIFAGILFSSVDGVLVSDAAAHIAFNNSSWIQVVGWLIFKRPGRTPNRRICKRALFALFLRAVVLLIDLAILGLSVPHSIPVYEQDVGSSVMSFSGIRTNPGSNISWAVRNSPCKPDNIRYVGFDPSVTRHICLLRCKRELLKNVSTLFKDLDLIRDDVYLLGMSKDNTTFNIRYVNEQKDYIYSHIMRLRNDTQYLLPPHVGIVDEVSDSLMKRHPGRCRIVLKPALVGKAVKCRKVTRRTNTPFKGDNTLYRLFVEVMNTRPLGAGMVWPKYKEFLFGPAFTNGVQVGTIDRPRVCIIPALILFLSCFFVAGILKLTKVRQELAFKQWAYISRSNGSVDMENPFFSYWQDSKEWKLGPTSSMFQLYNDKRIPT